MKEVFVARSTNGRFGLAVVSAVEGVEGEVTFPAKGSLRDLGSVEGVKTFLFTPSTEGLWVLPMRQQVKVHGGGAVVFTAYLQSGNYVSLLVMGSECVVETFGYKGRSSSVDAYVDGKRTTVPAPVLLAMGLVKGVGDIVAIPAPEPLQGQMAEAFASLRR